MFINLLHHLRNVLTSHYIGKHGKDIKESALAEQKKEGYRLEGESNHECDEYIFYLFIGQG